MKIFLVGGARPNFMKLAPIGRSLEKRNQEYILIHTGQHYDESMSDIFFQQLEMKNPDFKFDISNIKQSHARMTSEIMCAFEDLCFSERPDLVIVVGDVNSTVACAMVTSKIEGIKLAHVEAGARSFDRSMPEEVNRVITDVLSDYLFTISDEHTKHLLNEGIEEEKIHLVGDVMIDSLFHLVNQNTTIEGDPYILITLHRQSNVDNRDTLRNILEAIEFISTTNRLIFPIHPRTKKMIKTFGFENYLKNVEVIPPLGYFEFVQYMKNADIVLTDSGSIQVETTVLNIPCLTMRENTERMFTLTEGSNLLVGTDTKKIIAGVLSYLKNPQKSNLSTKHKELFDGHSAERIVDILLKV
jgi:UDP-N-acetylglucosamine 2-epimerase (non-hydrolysing)